MKIGIDFGTSYSNVSVYAKNQANPLAIHVGEDGRDGIPTVLYKSSPSNFIIGVAAQKQAIVDFRNNVNASNYITGIKKVIRPLSTIGLDSPNYSGSGKTAKELIQIFLNKLIEYAIREAEERGFTNSNYIEEVNIGCPAICDANYHSQLRTMVNAAVKQATGAEPTTVEVIPEPTLAALGYLSINERSSGNVLVFDMGGGTTDVAVVHVEKKNGVVLHKELVSDDGELECGGTDFDKALYALLLTKVGKTVVEAWAFVNSNASAYDLETMMLFKHQLSSVSDRTQSAPFFVSDRNVPQGFKCWRQCFVSMHELESFAVNKLNQAIVPLERIYGEFQRNYPQQTIDDIILVGGGSNMVAVQEKVKEKLRQLGLSAEYISNHVKLFSGHLSTAIADGAALYTTKNTKLRLPKTFGIDCLIAGYKSNNQHSEDTDGISNILIRNSREEYLPLVGTRGGYHPVKGFHGTHLKLEIFESLSEADSIDERDKDKGLTDKTIERTCGNTYKIPVIGIKSIADVTQRKYKVTIRLDESMNLEVTVYDEDLKENLLVIKGKQGEKDRFNTTFERGLKTGEAYHCNMNWLPKDLRDMGLSDSDSPVSDPDGENVTVKGLTGRYNIYSPSYKQYYAVRLGVTTQEDARMVYKKWTGLGGTHWKA